jgi:hypothetical protein
MAEHQYSPIPYARITATDFQGVTRRVTIRVTAESAQFLTGRQVNSQAEEPDVRQIHIIDKKAITKRVPLRQSLIYGDLETVVA